jgi:cystine transport system substrate-binding protein
VYLQSETERVRVQQQLVRRERGIAEHVLAISQRRLAERLRTLYEQGDVDPLAVLLGSQSLDEALTSIDAIQRISAQSERVIRQTTATKARLSVLTRRLLARRNELAALQQDAGRAAASLEATRAQRVSLIEALRTRERLNTRTIAALDVTARAAEARSAELAAARAAAPTPPDPATAPAAAATAPAAEPPAAGRALTVVATGYSIHGRTATGVPTGWGVAAVDPAVIPLGTRFDVPGYGVAVAADTGGAVQGATIDLWFPTLGQALAWGRRTVTISLH